jgi:hypothetical protein
VDGAARRRYHGAVATLGRFLQVLGLLAVPAGLLYGVASGRPNALQVELAVLAAGAVAFFAGTALARRGEGGG